MRVANTNLGNETLRQNAGSPPVVVNLLVEARSRFGESMAAVQRDRAAWDVLVWRTGLKSASRPVKYPSSTAAPRSCPCTARSATSAAYHRRAAAVTSSRRFTIGCILLLRRVKCRTTRLHCAHYGKEDVFQCAAMAGSASALMKMPPTTERAWNPTCFPLTVS